MEAFNFNLQRFAGMVYDSIPPNISIEGTADSDTFDNKSHGVTINAGDGNDSIKNDGAQVSIQGGKGNDSILNAFNGGLATIHGGKGDDYILNDGSHVVYVFERGDGNDTIEGFKSNNVLLVVGSAAAIVKNENNNHFMRYSGGEVTVKDQGNRPWHLTGIHGAHTFHNFIDGETLEGGDLNDTIINYGANNVVFKHFNGDGSDSIVGFNETSTLVLGKNSDRDDVEVYYKKHYTEEDILVGIYYSKPINQSVMADYTITLKGAASLTSVNIDGIDITPNDPYLVRLTKGDDTCDNTLNNATIFAYGGADSVTNTGANVFVNGGKDNDFIFNDGGQKATIVGGKGNDTISLSETVQNNLIKYTPGDGSDSIIGFNSTTTLKIGNGESDTYASVKSGNDISVTVGSAVITLVGAANSAGKILGKEITLVTLDDAANNYSNNNNDVMIWSFGGNDTIRNNAVHVTVDTGSGKDNIINNGAASSLAGGDDNDTIDNYASMVTITSGAGNDLVRNRANATMTEISTGDGNDVIDQLGTQGIIHAGKGNDRISLKGGYPTIGGANLIVYHEGDGNDVITGFGTQDTLMIVGAVNATCSTLRSGNGLSDVLVCVGNDTITLKSAASVAALNSGMIRSTIDPSIIEAPPADTPSGGNFTEGNDTCNNTVDAVAMLALGGDDSVTNSGASVTIDGMGGNDYIGNYGAKGSLSGGEGNDTLGNGTLGTFSNVDAGIGDDTVYNGGNNVTVNGGAGNDFIQTTAENDLIFGGDGNDVIYNLNSTVGSSVRNPQGTTIYGGDGNDSIYNNGDSVTINGGAGNDAIYNDGLQVTINAGTGNDRISLGSISTNDLIEYASGDGKDTVYGFDGDDTLQIGGGTGTYSTQQSGSDIIVTVGDGSILLKDAASLDAVNIAVEENTSAEDSWTLEDGVAKYKNLFTLSGINPNLTVDELDSVINVDGNKVILSADALAQTNVTLTTTGNYSLALDEDCPTVTATEKGWTLDGTTATYHDAGKSDGYKLTNSKTVTYTPAVVGKALLTVSGVVEGVSEEDLNENLTVSGKVLTVTPDVVGENFSVGAGYKVVFDEGDYGGSKFTGTTGRDTIEVNGNGLQIDGGKGNDTITSNGEGGNTYLFNANGGKDVVVGYGDDDTIKITDDSNVTASVKASDIIVKAGKATMTLKNAATGTQLNIVDADDETLIDQTFYADRTVADGEVKLLSTFNSTSFTATDENPNVDGSAVSRKFSLTGGDEDNTLIGGKGANFINGGGGSNELTGGKGNDTFVAGNGTDTITDYGVGTDKISLAADVTGFEVDGSDVILNFDDDKSMTIANGAGKKINFVRNGRTTPEIFMTGGKLSSNSKSITLASGTGSFDAGTVTTLVTIDGGLTENVFITGNAQSNKIFGGDGSDTLDGGAKNDTLTGGDGNDIFIYESGKDVIADYVSGKDKISLAAAPISESLNSKGDVVLKFSSANQLTIKGGDEILFVTDGGEVTKTYLNDRIVGNDGVTLQSNFKATEFTLEELPKVDASATSAKVTITGNNNDNTIIGSKGNNLIDGGAGDDILIGKGGADTFVYSSGDDTISDYESRDRVSLTSAIESFDLNGDDVIIGFGSSSLTIADAANASITFLETTDGKVTTSVNVFASEGIFNKAKTAVTLNADTSNYTASTSMLTIDGGLASDAIEIVGNAKANKIFAGDFGSTLNGGGGKDSLWGGNGSDTFIYSSGGGNDVIYNFGNDDALQIVGNFTASVVGENISFKVGSTANAITLKDFTATTFNVNGDTYRISGNNFVK